MEAVNNLEENKKDEKKSGQSGLGSFSGEVLSSASASASTSTLASVAVEPFRQTPGLCGPASLKILLSHFGKTFSEEQLAQLSYATREAGTEHEGMVQAIKSINGFAFVKEDGTMEELEYFVKEEKLPVIIGWFDRDEDHYSVVVNITDKNVIMVDPSSRGPERWFDKEVFPGIWFDFSGKESKIVCWGWYLVVTFEKRKFKIKGGYYY